MGAITDIDGNVYDTVVIGSQEWTVQNLKTTKLNDGTAIPEVTDNSAWAALTTPGRCAYNNDPANRTIYGELYNWYAVGIGNLAPAGWRVPTDADWTTLTTYLGGLTVAGGKLKESGTTHWHSPNTSGTNEVGFSALPGGCRLNNDGTFFAIGLLRLLVDRVGLRRFLLLVPHHALRYRKRVPLDQPSAVRVQCSPCPRCDRSWRGHGVHRRFQRDRS